MYRGTRCTGMIKNEVIPMPLVLSRPAYRGSPKSISFLEGGRASRSLASYLEERTKIRIRIDAATNDCQRIVVVVNVRLVQTDEARSLSGWKVKVLLYELYKWRARSSAGGVSERRCRKACFGATYLSQCQITDCRGSFGLASHRLTQ